MISLNKQSIKKQITVYMLITSSILIIVQFMTLISIINIGQNRSYEYITSILNNAESYISKTADNLERAGYTISFNQLLSNYYSYNKAYASIDLTPIYEMIRLMCDYNSDLLDVTIIDLNNRTRSFYAGVNDIILDELKKIYNFSDPSNTKRQYIFFTNESSLRDEYYCYLVPIYKFNFDSSIDFNHKLATAVFINKMSQIKEILASVNEEQALFACFDNKNNLLLSNNNINVNTNSYPKKQLSINNAFKKNIRGINLQFVAIPPKKAAYLNVLSSILFIIIETIIVIISVIFIAYFLNRTITLPILQLEHDMEQVGKGGLTKRISLTTSFDINSIVKNINQMLDKLEITTQKAFETQNRLYEMELRKREAELYALQSQINPHFLYNTLQCMRGIAICHGIKDVANMCTSLSSLFRYSIKGDEIVTVADEVYILEQYISILKLRFDDKIKFIIDIDHSILEIKVIKMILQPIVENAVTHGLSEMDSGGYIAITGLKQNNMLIFSVKDNGKGIEPELLSDINNILETNISPTEGAKSRYMGLYNINRRIRLHFGDKYGLKILSGSNGTEVLLTFPLIH